MAARMALTATDESTSPELKARIEAHLGSLEVQAGQISQGRARIRAAIPQADSREVWLAFARASEGPERDAGYANALGAPQAGDYKPLLDEIEAAGLDPALIVRAALEVLEARSLEREGVRLGHALYQRDPGRGTAFMFWKALLLSWRADPSRLSAVAGIANVEDLKRLLAEPLQDLIGAKESLLKARLDLGKVDDAASKVEAAIRALEAVAAKIPRALADELRVPLAVNTAWGSMSQIGPKDQRERCRRQALAGFEDWLARPNHHPRVPLWIGTLKAVSGDYRGAIESMTAGLSEKPRPPLRGSLLLEIGSIYARLGEEDQALDALDRSLRFLESPSLKVAALVLRAEILLRREDAAGAHVATTRAYSLASERSGAIYQRLSLASIRIMIDGKAPLEMTQRLVQATETLVRKTPTMPIIRADLLAAKARLRRAEGALEAALSLCDEALKIYPAAGEAHLERVEVLLALDRKEEALRFARAAEKAPLPPRDLERMKKVAERLEGGG
jgi:tetratricopeptide (TPR) repeat protein